jgi:hypothetical protein
MDPDDPDTLARPARRSHDDSTDLGHLCHTTDDDLEVRYP